MKNSGITVTDIEWDIDEPDIEKNHCKPKLPNEVEIPMSVITDAINDYLSDTYAYTIKGFTIFLSLKQR